MNIALKFIRSKIFTIVLLFLFCLFLALSCKSYDYDLYARLIVGENFFEQHVFNYYDYLSYTPTHPWFDHEYGASLVFYLFYKYLGNFGFILVQTLLIFFTGFFVIKTQSLQKHTYPVSSAFMSIFYLLMFYHNQSLVRCHLFSFLFFSIFLYILEKTRKTKSGLIWLLIPLVVLWNNIHGGVVSGLGLIGIYFVCELLQGKPFKKYLYVILISVPLLAINPYGVKYLKFLFSANTMSRKYIVEWWTVFSPRHTKNYYPVVIFSFFGFVSSIFKHLSTKKFDLTKFTVFAVTMFVGVMHIKLLPFVLIIASSLYYNDFIRIFNKNVFRLSEISLKIFMMLVILLIPFKNPAEARTSLTKFPVKEVEFLKINGIEGNLLTDFGYGSYAAYKLYPNNLIYMDGRFEEVYNPREYDNLKYFSLADENWENVYKQYPTNILMPSKTLDVYTKKLENSDLWVKVYEGNVCGIFVKRENLKKNYIMPSDNYKYYQENEFTNKGTFIKLKDNEDEKQS